MPGYPEYFTTPGGGGGTRRLLMVYASEVNDWIIFFTVTAPLCPYTLNAVVWNIKQRPFEQQERVAANLAFGPGIALYDFSLLEIEYESTGMRYFPGQGVVKEEQRPRIESVPTGIMRYSVSAVGNEAPTLSWVHGDPQLNTFLYYGEHPHCEVGSREISVTFPFAPTGAEPSFGEGSVNSDAFQLPVTGDICPPGTLKYMGCAKEASVVIPAVGIYTGLIRFKKTFIFHYLNASVGVNNSGISGQRLTWNWYFRARDQLIGQMQDMSLDPYYQYRPAVFSSQNWFL